jgi:hypothetical protein
MSIMASTEVWKMGEHYFEFERTELPSLLISKNCANKPCEAKNILKIVSLKNITSKDLTGGKNPGAVICHKLKNANLVYLRDLKGNDNSFCLFADKSFVSSGSLEIQARKNDEK